jgi:hypothetical protein
MMSVHTVIVDDANRNAQAAAFGLVNTAQGKTTHMLAAL